MLGKNSCYIGGIQRFSTEDGPGIRTTVFLKGCPLKCAWCHNPEMISPYFMLLYKEHKCIKCGQCIKNCPQGALSFENGAIFTDMIKCAKCMKCVKTCPAEALYTKSNEMTVDEVIEEVVKDREFYEASGGGVTLSGGEILANASFAAEVAEKCRELGISVAADTSGFGKFGDLMKLAEISDVILYDLKHMDRETHKKLTGQYPDIIWDNLIRLSEYPEIKKKIIIRVPFIHPLNDSTENTDALCKFMKKHGLDTVNFLPYHSMGISKAKEVDIIQDKYEEPSEDTLAHVRKKFEENNIKVTIMGKES